MTLDVRSFTNPANGRPTSPFRVAVFDREDYDIGVTSAAKDQSADASGVLSVQMREPFLITENATLRTNTDITTAPIVITI